MLDVAVGAFAKTPVKMVAARNLFFGEASKFKIWNDGDARKSFQKAKGLEVDFPELDDSVVAATFCAHPKVRFSSPTGLQYGHVGRCRAGSSRRPRFAFGNSAIASR